MFLALTLMASFGANAENVIFDETTVISDVQGIQYIRDPEHLYSIDSFSTATRPETLSEWNAIQGSNINFLYDKSTYWFKFHLRSKLSKRQRWVLDINWPFIDRMNWFIVDINGNLIKEVNIGDKSANPFNGGTSRLHQFDFDLGQNQDLTFLLQVKTSSSIILPIRISRSDIQYVNEQRNQAGYGLFFGGLLVMALYNGFISIFTRDRSYAYYVLYLLAIMFYAASISGFGSQHIWGGFALIQDIGLSLSVALGFLSAALFIDHFLNLKNRNVFAHKLVMFSVFMYSLLSISALLLPESIVVTIEQPVGLIACFVAFLVAWFEWSKGSNIAKYFLVAWSLLIFGTCIYTLMLLGLVPRNSFTENVQMAGMAIEMLVLSIALAARINRSRIERLAALQALMESSQERLEVEAEVKARGEFFAKMSHEIRTPIGGVLGIADLLKETSITDKQRKYVDTIYNAGTSLLTIVNDILDFSKMDSGNLEIESIPFDLPRLVQESVDIVAVTSDETKVQFVMIVDDSIPHSLMGDPVRLRQVLLNLLGNANKFTVEGKITIKVECTHDECSSITLKFCVVDEGIGLTPKQINNLFQPFKQADSSTTRRFGGTGLGLAICKELVELMAGNIGVESILGQGATFWFSVKLEKPNVSESDCLDCTNDKAIDNEPYDFTSIKLLVAEDNAVNLMVLKGMLKKYNITAEFVNDGRSALEAYKAHHQDYSGILMDCEMPIMDGFQASKAIREFEVTASLPAIEIIALTAHSYGDFLEKAKGYGMNQHLMKPISDKMLLEQVASLQSNG